MTSEKDNELDGSTQRRISNQFIKEIEDIKIERIKRGLDKKNKSDPRITLAITRCSLWPKMKEKIIEGKMGDKNE